jgi:hypothetical protein
VALQGDEGGAPDAQEALHLVEAMLADHATRAPGFALVRESWDALVKRFPGDSAARVIDELGGLCTRRDRQDFVAFFQPRAEALRGGPRKYAQALESIDICIATSSAGEAAPRTRAAPPPKRAKGKSRAR